MLYYIVRIFIFTHREYFFLKFTVPSRGFTVGGVQLTMKSNTFLLKGYLNYDRH